MDKDIRGETDMIRQAKPEDLECIKAVAKRSKRKMNDEGNPQWNGSYPEAFYEDDIHNRQLYVYEIGGTIVGAVCISTEGHEEYAEIPWTYKEPYLCMKRLAVDPDYQGKSIAQSFFVLQRNWVRKRVSIIYAQIQMRSMKRLYDYLTEQIINLLSKNTKKESRFLLDIMKRKSIHK